MAHVQTVTGRADPADLGGVLSHEHLLALAPGPGLGEGPLARQQVALAVSALRGLRARGIGTVVDLSPYGDAGRDADGGNVALLREISRESGLHVVSGTASYREGFSPGWVRQASLDELTRRFIADATTGIGGTGVRAGILGELPAGLGELTAHEAKGLRAAARAHLATGLAVSTHTTHGTMALEQVDLLAGEGADLTRVVIGHMDNHPELDYVRRVLDRGVSIAFDSVGKQDWDVRLPPRSRPDGPYDKDAIRQSDLTRADRLARLAAAGYAGQILLSLDLTGGQAYLNAETHGRWGYAYLPAVFIPMLAERGVTPAQIHAMLHDNPARMLTIG